jgi:hypothetical protein
MTSICKFRRVISIQLFTEANYYIKFSYKEKKSMRFRQQFGFFFLCVISLFVLFDKFWGSRGCL